jgi:phosphoribosylformylglycinamidine synthase
MAFDYNGKRELPLYRAFACSRFTDPVAGSRTAIASFIEYCLGIKGGLDGISLSANWMWA